ncbi:MAG: hypothetical protein JWP08_203 [Bryobacterales bacterium]|nr:hypothetical protein [Bryobacterales bacterium]
MLLFTFRSTRLAIARRLSCNTPRCYFSAKGTCYDSKGGLWLVFPQRDVELSLPLAVYIERSEYSFGDLLALTPGHRVPTHVIASRARRPSTGLDQRWTGDSHQ